jgi:hypothetical protein
MHLLKLSIVIPQRENPFTGKLGQVHDAFNTIRKLDPQLVVVQRLNHYWYKHMPSPYYDAIVPHSSLLNQPGPITILSAKLLCYQARDNLQSTTNLADILPPA